MSFDFSHGLSLGKAWRRPAAGGQEFENIGTPRFIYRGSSLGAISSNPTTWNDDSTNGYNWYQSGGTNATVVAAGAGKALRFAPGSNWLAEHGAATTFTNENYIVGMAVRRNQGGAMTKMTLLGSTSGDTQDIFLRYHSNGTGGLAIAINNSTPPAYSSDDETLNQFLTVITYVDTTTGTAYYYTDGNLQGTSTTPNGTTWNAFSGIVYGWRPTDTGLNLDVSSMFATSSVSQSDVAAVHAALSATYT